MINSADPIRGAFSDNDLFSPTDSIRPHEGFHTDELGDVLPLVIIGIMPAQFLVFDVHGLVTVIGFDFAILVGIAFVLVDSSYWGGPGDHVDYFAVLPEWKNDAALEIVPERPIR